MRNYSVVELVLLLAALVVVLKVEGITKIWVSLVCLLVVLILERIQKRLKEEQEARQRMKKFSMEGLRKKMEAGRPNRRGSEVDESVTPYRL